MAILRFKTALAGPIIEGRKTQTLRQKLPGGIREGETVDAASSYRLPPWGRLRIDQITETSLPQLTEGDAQREGMDSLEDLREALQAIYPEADRFVSIRFACVDWDPAYEPFASINSA